MRQRWRNALIVKLLGRRIRVGFMKKKLESLWAKADSITVADLGNEFFSVRLSSLEDLNLAITGGPWIILGHYLATRKWEPCFDPDKANIHKVAAWVRLPGVPQEYCEFPFLNQLGDVIGKVLKVDRTTSIGDRERFARVCIQVDLSKPLRGEYILDGCRKIVEYEGLFLICLKCGKYGHNAESCPDYVKLCHATKEEGVPDPPMKDQCAQGIGPWMVVQRRKRNQQVYQKKEAASVRKFGEDISNLKETEENGRSSKTTQEVKQVTVISSQQAKDSIRHDNWSKENEGSEKRDKSSASGMNFSAAASSQPRKNTGGKTPVS
ncbi:uncharacterized protein LOC133283801 [Gastrolobium bilobum]|uniref:uncharacterized protein LOC133283801 n=1 Tax=Gastrolobium bilobum TaxID=150636 RepID=UPI002AB1E070|nr:uncharacterized protein LOC133283801 [Gastrolobium bilobum]